MQSTSAETLDIRKLCMTGCRNPELSVLAKRFTTIHVDNMLKSSFGDVLKRVITTKTDKLMVAFVP